MGVFYLGISALPKSLTAIVRIVGFAGNKEKGQRYLNLCMEEGKCRAPYAALVLSLYLVDMDPQLNRVCNILNKNLANYPHSTLFYWIASIVAWKYS